MYRQVFLAGVTLSVSAFGAQKSQEPQAESLGTASAVPYCPSALADAAGGGCIGASSVPTMGMLYPLSTDFFMDAASGWIGMGTTSPTARLHVIGDQRIGGDLFFNDNNDGIQFSSFNPLFQQPDPMVTMFESGASNPDRMVIGHSPLFEDWGLEYQDTGDEFVFQRGPSTPVVTVDLAPGDPSLKVRGHETSQQETLRVDRVGIPDIGTSVLSLVAASSSLPGLSHNFIACDAFNDPDRIVFRVTDSGNVLADGSYTGPADFAEMIEVSSGSTSVEPGDLLVIDPRQPRSVVRSAEARSRLVMGVYSTEPGFVGSERDWDEVDATGRTLSLDRDAMAERYDEVPVAVVGIVPVKASAENGPIEPGDLLVSAGLAGHVMRDEDPKVGTVVGKALGSLAKGTGLIKILVTLQ